jgi:hypothetical protein
VTFVDGTAGFCDFWVFCGLAAGGFALVAVLVTVFEADAVALRALGVVVLVVDFADEARSAEVGCSIGVDLDLLLFPVATGRR